MSQNCDSKLFKPGNFLEDFLEFLTLSVVHWLTSFCNSCVYSCSRT